MFKILGFRKVVRIFGVKIDIYLISMSFLVSGFFKYVYDFFNIILGSIL